VLTSSTLGGAKRALCVSFSFSLSFSNSNSNSSEKEAVAEPPTHKGISFTEFIEIVKSKDERCDYLVQRYKVQRNDFDNYMVMRQFNMFIDYWSEKSPNGKKERWQKETVFEVARRLTTWFARARISEIDMKEIEKEKVKRKLEQSQKLLNDQNNG